MWEEVFDLTEKPTGLKFEILELNQMHEIINCFVAPFDKHNALMANDMGELINFEHNPENAEFTETLICEKSEGEHWLDAVPVKSLGAILLADTNYKLTLVFPSGARRQLTDAEPLMNKKGVLTRLSPNENILALGIQLGTYEAIKVYPKFGDLNFTESVIIKLFPHTAEGWHNDLVNDFRVTDTRVIGASSRGVISIWNFKGEKTGEIEAFNWREECLRIDNIAISGDGKFIACLTSCGTITIRSYYLSFYSLEGDTLKSLGDKIHIRQGARGMWLHKMFKNKEGGYTTIAGNDHRDTRIYTVDSEGKNLEWIHEHKGMNFGYKHSTYLDGTLWVVDTKYAVMKITGNGL